MLTGTTIRIASHMETAAGDHAHLTRVASPSIAGREVLVSVTALLLDLLPLCYHMRTNHPEPGATCLTRNLRLQAELVAPGCCQLGFVENSQSAGRVLDSGLGDAPRLSGGELPDRVDDRRQTSKDQLGCHGIAPFQASASMARRSGPFPPRGSTGIMAT
jgi:hypothetical protein